MQSHCNIITTVRIKNGEFMSGNHRSKQFRYLYNLRGLQEWKVHLPGYGNTEAG